MPSPSASVPSIVPTTVASAEFSGTLNVVVDTVGASLIGAIVILTVPVELPRR